MTTAKCLSSIFKGNMNQKDYKIYIVDDACTDYTNKFLYLLKKENRPIVTFHNPIQLGYVGSTNKALKALDTDYFVFMNNDVLLDKNCLQELFSEMVNHPEYGILGATQYDTKKVELSPLKYFIRGERATVWNHIELKNLPKKLDDIIPVDITHFACSISKREVIEKIGLLDERFSPGCYEQEDWCLKTKLAGFKIGVVPKAKFIHKVSISTSDKPDYWTSILSGNRLKFWTKWGESLQKCLI